jgi:NhaA family Na+:H+ antiporter
MEMTAQGPNHRLDRPVDESRDHVLGPRDAQITLVEYGSYACPHCRAANARIGEVRNQLGDRLRYVFRHKPLAGSDLARRAAELVEHARDPEQFWKTHVELMTRSERLTEDDLRAVAEELGVAPGEPGPRQAAAQARVTQDEDSARASGVRFTPTFFINGRRYDGPWDESSFIDAMLGSLGHRVSNAALTFASWAPSTGVMLLVATVAALILANSSLGPAFERFWQQELGFAFGEAAFRLSLLHWINDALLTIFFLVVGLEIKREFTVGHLATRRSAALPLAAALGGMVAPAAIFLAVIPSGPWSAGWGVPIATDTAFAVALIAVMGARVPIELRVFLTAAAIADDIVSIGVVAVFYSGELRYDYLGLAAIAVGMLAFLHRSGVYRALPYAVVGVLLWLCVDEGGLHATLAGVILAAFIPTRPPPDYRTLIMQADSILAAEARHEGEQYRTGPSTPALQALDAIYNRLESPASRMLRHLAPRSSLLVLPVFALANAGVVLGPEVFSHHRTLMLALAAGLVIGKPVGFLAASALAVRLGLAHKPSAYSWRQLAGAGALAGIGFTMSLFIAGQAFPSATDFAAAKVAVFAASLVSAAIGMSVLWRAGSEGRDEARNQSPGTPETRQRASL